MFDDYLNNKEVADVGTITSAAAHLKAVMDLKAKPKVISVVFYYEAET